MRRIIVLAALVTSLAAPVVAQENPHQVVRALALGHTPRDLDMGQLPAAARITLFAGTDATVSLIELGDKSPLKKQLPAQAWDQLVGQAPMLAQASHTMREALVLEVLEALEKHDLELPRTASFVSGGMVLASGKVEDLLQKATLIFSARAVLALARDGRVVRKLAFMAIDPRVPAEVRKQAGIATAIAAGVELQQTIAEANLLKELEGF